MAGQDLPADRTLSVKELALQPSRLTQRLARGHTHASTRPHTLLFRHNNMQQNLYIADHAYCIDDLEVEIPKLLDHTSQPKYTCEVE